MWPKYYLHVFGLKNPYFRWESFPFWKFCEFTFTVVHDKHVVVKQVRAGPEDVVVGAIGLPEDHEVTAENCKFRFKLWKCHTCQCSPACCCRPPCRWNIRRSWTSNVHWTWSVSAWNSQSRQSASGCSRSAPGQVVLGRRPIWRMFVGQRDRLNFLIILELN